MMWHSPGTATLHIWNGVTVRVKPTSQLCNLTPTSAEAPEARPALAGGFKKQAVIAVRENGCSTPLTYAPDSTGRLGKRLENIALSLLGKDSLSFDSMERSYKQPRGLTYGQNKMNTMLFVWSAPENLSSLIPGESEPVGTGDIPSALRLRPSLDHLWPALQCHNEGCRSIPSPGPPCASLTPGKARRAWVSPSYPPHPFSIASCFHFDLP